MKIWSQADLCTENLNFLCTVPDPRTSSAIFRTSLASYNLMVSRSPLASMQPFGITTSPYLITPLLLARSNYCSVAQLNPTPCDPVDCSMPGFPVLHYLPEFAQTHIHLVGHVIQPSYPRGPLLLLLPSIFPSIRVFSNESVLPIRWPKYWSLSFSISPCNEYSGLISFRIDQFGLLADPTIILDK